MSKLLSLFASIPKIINLISRVVERFERSERIQREKRRRENAKKAIEEGDEELGRKILSDTISSIRRNLSQ